MYSKMLFYLLLVLSLCVFSVISNSDITNDEISEELEEETLRLPNDTWPLSYFVHIKTNIHQRELEYTGTVRIRLKVNNDTNKIVLHAGKDMDKFKISLVDIQSEMEIKNITYTYDNVTTFLKIYSENGDLNLKSGSEYLLTISYSNYHSVTTNGFYQLVLNNTVYKDLWFAVTHFEATYARQVFPCYDEPAFKAKFIISLTHGSNYTAISNMPVDGEPIVGEDGMTTTKFLSTPLMSTYGIAFAVIIHDAITEKKYNVLHRIFSLSNTKDKGHFALDIATESLEKLENYFNLDYPLPKMDHISVAKREGRGMENWGLTIYEDGWLLLNTDSSVFYNMSVAVVIVHEMAHQWFGNLVSPKWWTYTWLNEGLASFYSYKVIESLHPEWHVMDYAKTFEMGLATWRLPSILKLTQYVETEKDIAKTFGYHAYFVASFVLQMFEAALTEKTFQKGVTGYLHKFQYSVTEEDDLFDQLQIAATEDKIPFFEEPGSVKKTMKTWSNQIGHPLVTVIRNYDNGTITIYQEDSVNGTASDRLWWIPITVATARDPNFDNLTTDFILPNTRSYTINLTSFKELEDDDWIILNKQQLGPYRVNYDEQNWKLIIKALRENPKSMHSHCKAQLIQDAAAFVESGLLPNKTLIQLLSYLKEEDDVIPWFEALSTLNELRQAFNKNMSMQYFNYFGRDLIRKVFNTIGVESKQDDVPFVDFIRPKIFEFACIFELEECLEISQRIFDDVFRYNRTAKVSQRSKEFIYTFVFDKLPTDDFRLVIDFLLLGNNIPEKLTVIDAFTYSHNYALISAVSQELNITISENRPVISEMRKLFKSQMTEDELT